MKKIFFGIMILTATWYSAQNYPQTYTGGQDEYYQGNDYIPDDYYYEYPSDYYTDDYYHNYYDEYQNSINQVNWNDFFVRYQLSRLQMEQIMYLNQMYPSYATWNQYYRYNPDRWYYDRFFAMQEILGPNLFITFQNVYYNGYSPVVYYRNYRTRIFRPSICVMPRYRNVNINIYRVDRRNYHAQNGWYNPRNNGFRSNGATPRVRANSGVDNGFRNESRMRNQNNGGFRSGQNPNVSSSRDQASRERTYTPNTQRSVRSNTGSNAPQIGNSNRQNTANSSGARVDRQERTQNNSRNMQREQNNQNRKSNSNVATARLASK